MRRMCGFILFWIAVGMLLMFLIPNLFFQILAIAFCICLGYYLFCC